MVHSLMSICALKHVVFIVAAQHMSRTWIYCNERFHAQTRQYAFWACAWFIAPKGCNAVHTRRSRCFKCSRVLHEGSSFFLS